MSIRNNELSLELQQWLDRLADLYDDHELFPDGQPIGKLVRQILRRYDGQRATPALDRGGDRTRRVRG
jgi:hypothetical protein